MAASKMIGFCVYLWILANLSVRNMIGMELSAIVRPRGSFSLSCSAIWADSRRLHRWEIRQRLKKTAQKHLENVTSSIGQTIWLETN